MLSYQHSYHAGNFADVVKHIGLSLICDYLVKKDKPLFYLETHSGRGLYDLKGGFSQKTAEYQDGVGRLWPHRQQLPEEFQPWLAGIEALNDGQQLRYYPGSPLVAVQHLREMDRLYCCELHPKEFEALRQLPKDGKKVFFKHCDGMEQMNALLPPKEKRGLIFIDPAYELKSEYKTIPEAIQKAYRKFSTGVYCLWYPMVDEGWTSQLNRGMERIDCADKLHIEFRLNPALDQGMTGCGLWLLNPPYLFKQQMEKVVEVLKHYLS